MHRACRPGQRLRLAVRDVRGGLETLESGRTKAEIDRLDGRSWVRRAAVPFLVQFTEPSVELHALDDLLNLVAILGVFQTEGIGKVTAVEVLVAYLDGLVLTRSEDCGRNFIQSGEGATRQDC